MKRPQSVLTVAKYFRELKFSPAHPQPLHRQEYPLSQLRQHRLLTCIYILYSNRNVLGD